MKTTRDGHGASSESQRPALFMDRASEAAVTRLSSYYRALGDFEAQQVGTISSKRLAERCGINPAQVRKDLSFFGNFGRRGLGYNVPQLRVELRGILGLARPWSVALVGAGNLGHALFAYKGFQRQGFQIQHVFDSDPDKIGQAWDGVRIHDVADLRRVAAQTPIEIAILAVPAPAAQSVVDALVAAGVRGILNFTPGPITTPEKVAVRHVDLSIAMESLSYTLVKK